MLPCDPPDGMVYLQLFRRYEDIEREAYLPSLEDSDAERINPAHGRREQTTRQHKKTRQPASLLVRYSTPQ